MKEQIKTLMAQKKLDAILISGSREHNPSLTYFVGDAFFTHADVLVMKDRDPLLFYRAIAEYGTHALCRGGRLYFEINRAYGKETVKMLEMLGYHDIELRKDAFGNDRMIRAISN